MLNLTIKNPKLLVIKVLLIFVPVYAIAYFTQNMIYILPTLAVGLLFGTNLTETSEKDEIDEDSDMSEMDTDVSD